MPWKLPLDLKHPRYPSRSKKCYMHDRKNMGYNLKEITEFLKSRQYELSRNIKFSKNGKGRHKKCMPESKQGLRTLTAKKRYETAPKPKNTYTNASVLEPAFRRFFRIRKIPPYAEVMAKKPTGPPKQNWGCASKEDADAGMTSCWRQKFIPLNLMA